MSEEIIVYVDSDLEDITPEFLENRHEDVIKIKELLEANKLDEIQRLGHSMKGSGGGYGFQEVSKIGAELENAATVEDKAEIEHLGARLKDYLSVVKVVYQDMDY